MAKKDKVAVGQVWVEKLSPRSTKTPRRIEITSVNWNGWVGYRNARTGRPAAIFTENLPKAYALEVSS